MNNTKTEPAVVAKRSNVLRNSCHLLYGVCSQVQIPLKACLYGQIPMVAIAPAIIVVPLYSLCQRNTYTYLRPRGHAATIKVVGNIICGYAAMLPHGHAAMK